MFFIILFILPFLPYSLGCTLDQSSVKIIDETLISISYINSNITYLNMSIANTTNTTKYIEYIKINNDRLKSLITLLGYNTGYNNTNSITIKQYTETYFPAITLTLLLLVLIVTVTNLVFECKHRRTNIL